MRVLVFEDNLREVELMARRFEKAKIEAHFADLGNSSANEVSKYLPDLILMDIFIPEKDGIIRTDEIREKYGEEIPIIGMTTATILSILNSKAHRFDIVLDKCNGFGYMYKQMQNISNKRSGLNILN